MPADLADGSFFATGIALRIEILPGKELKGIWVDAAKAQQIAKGNSKAKSVLDKDEYSKVARQHIRNIFFGGFVGTQSCDDEQRANPLRLMNLYAVESINGFSKISELLTSVKAKADK